MGKVATTKILALTVLTSLIAGCAASPSHVSGTPRIEASPPASAMLSPLQSEDALRTLLLDSWVTDGHRGYFIEGVADPHRAAFSIEETYWNVKLAELDPSRKIDLDRTRVATWLNRAFGGSYPDGLAPIAQISYSVDLAAHLGIKVDPSSVVAKLNRLYANGQYRTYEEDEVGNWGSTALAVNVLSRLGESIPPEVTESAKRALSEIGDEGGANVVIQNVAPLLSIASNDPSVGRSQSRTHLNSILQNASRQLQVAGPDVVGLAAENQLHDAARTLDLENDDQKGTSINCRLVRPGGGVSLPGIERDDLQATYYALKLGCSSAKAPPISAHSRAGWVAPLSSSTKVLGPTLAAVRLASNLSMLDQFRAGLIGSLKESWVPTLQIRREADLDTIVLVARAKEIAFRVGFYGIKSVYWKVPHDSAAIMLAHAIGLSLDASSNEPAAKSELANLASDARKFARQSPTYYAAILEVASRTLKRRNLHEEALTIVAGLRIGTNVYGAEGGAAKIITPSFTASVVGSWVEGSSRVSLARLIDAGLCAPDGRCAETPSDLSNTRHYSLQVLSVVTALRFEDGPIYPMPL